VCALLQINGLPFNKYTWLVTHNSFSIVDAPPLPGVQRLTFYNQEDTVTNQLRVCGPCSSFCFYLVSIFSFFLVDLFGYSESGGERKTEMKILSFSIIQLYTGAKLDDN